jgi:hypothetical protein
MELEFRRKPPVPVRIGLHSGDVIFDDEQIFGDGVNVASRIESLGIAGSILLSDKIQDELINHREFNTVSIGTYQFKNVIRKIEVFALKHHELKVPVSPSSSKLKPRKPLTVFNRQAYPVALLKKASLSYHLSTWVATRNRSTSAKGLVKRF